MGSPKIWSIESKSQNSIIRLAEFHIVAAAVNIHSHEARIIQKTKQHLLRCPNKVMAPMRPLSCKMAYGHGKGMLTTSRPFGGKNIYLLFIDIKYFYYMRWYRIFEHHVHRRAFQRWEHTGHIICRAETKPAFPLFPAATLSRCPRVLSQPNRFLHPNTSLFVCTALCK